MNFDSVPRSVACLLSPAFWILNSGFLILCSVSFALGPHEVLLLANRQSPRSLELARTYAGMRQIPEANLVTLDLPPRPALEMTPTEFTTRIWDPARQAIRERGLDDHILAWVYSVDFPVRITATPSLSIQGLTFLKGRLPEPIQVEKGTYGSPLFAGPETPRVSGFPAQSLDVQSAWLGPDMPLPSMMLGYMGPNGNTREEILSCLKAGVASDRTRPDGMVLILTNSDIRTQCRAWEFEPALRELTAQDLTALMAPAPPTDADGPVPLIGVMAGAAELPGIAKGQFRFRPGAIAEHLTSFGAVFDNNGQTKITEWIRAGATASAGTVTEPYSAWQKFPHARVFSFQMAGCTVLESLIQSIRCPLQILLIGEPLASPWAPGSTITLTGLDGGVLERATSVTVKITAHPSELFNRFTFLLDGRTFQQPGPFPTTTLEPASLPSGRHTLRVVAHQVGPVRSQIFAETSFEVK